MEKLVNKQAISIRKMTFSLLKIIVFSYILTGLLLFLLAFLMYKLDLADNAINLGVIIIMVLSTFVGGLLAAKSARQKGWLYGMMTGILYFLILVIISLFINKDSKIANDAITLFLMCVGGGTLGGMLG